MVVKTVKETVNKKCKPLQRTEGSHEEFQDETS